MPPVFNPLSPSSARLWSCDVGNIFAVLPSHSACSEISDAFEKFLDDHVRARRAEGFADHDFVHGLFGFGLVRANQNAFAQRKAVGFHHAFAASEAQNFFAAADVGESSGRRRGDAVFLHEFLGENLGRLELRGFLVHAPDSQAVFLEQIHDAQRQRIVRTDDGEINFLFLRECEQLGQILRADVDAFDRRCRFSARPSPARCRRCPARTTFAWRAATARVSRPARVRVRPNR